MSDEKALYWLTQVIGWFLFVLLILFQNFLTGQVDVGIIRFLLINFMIGLGLSHFMRYVIIQLGMLRMKIFAVLPRIVMLSIATGFTAALLIGTISDLFFKDVDEILVMPFTLLLELLLPFTMVFLIWNVLYFATIYLKNYEKEEIKNLRLSASMNEVELGNLRSQLNPHFMFNALNSIKALIDENPEQAKLSVTKMSNILRSSLTSGKKRLVGLDEEIRVVRDYLDLEKIRFEERLNYSFEIPETLSNVQVPPLLLQTLVENAVKHGIGQLPEGGEIKLSAKALPEGYTELNVINTGKYDPFKRAANRGTGIGLTNSRRRLKLIYGEKAYIEIYANNESVVCSVVLPLKPKSFVHDENNTN
jgi:signal transduction histidine kinase